MPDRVFQRFLNVLPDAVWLLNDRMLIEAANTRAAGLLGRHVGDLIGHSMLDFLDREPEAAARFLRRASTSGSSLPGKLTLATPDGPAVFSAYAAAFRGEAGRLIALRCVEGRQVSRVFQALEDRLMKLRSELHRERRLQSELQQALTERETLLSEVHHRVRNNLQVITSLLNLQMRKHGAGEAQDALREAQIRIQALALAHNQLYRETSLEQIDVARLLLSLSQTVIRTFGASERINVASSLFSWPLTVAHASPLALLVTEAVTNALKHAFPDGRSGTIRLEAWQTDEQTVLRIVDDGVGMSGDQGDPGRRSIGFEVMRAMARQLDAQLEIGHEHGVEVRLTLKRADAGSQASNRIAPQASPMSDAQVQNR